MNVLANELMKYYEEIQPYDFYREIFGDGELDEVDQFTKGKYNAIALEITDKKRMDKKTGREKTIVYRHTVTDDLDMVDELQYSPHFCVMAPISYVGKSRCSKNARIMYALGVEIDHLNVKKNGQQVGLENLIDMYADQAHWLPKPTFIVASGNGVHLYYQFERPLVLFPNTITSLKKYKQQLTKMLWTKSITRDYTDDKIQQESVFQAFRMPGTLTRHGDKAVAFRVGPTVSIEYMNSFMYSSLKGTCDIEGTYKSNLLLKEAKEKYPEWYQKVIIEKDHRPKEWALSRNVYDWWLRKIKEEAVDGHRYHCLMMLAIYAIKCSNYDEKKNPNPVTQEEFEQDCWGLLEDFDKRGKRSDNPFTEYDILCAIQVYEDRGMITYPRNSIAYKSGITIVPQIPRNGQKQEWHLEDCREKKIKMKRRNQPFKNPEGRPSAEDQVKAYRRENPEAKKADCIRETGLSKPTVYKWWNGEEAEKKKQPAKANENDVKIKFDTKNQETAATEIAARILQMSESEQKKIWEMLQKAEENAEK